MSNLVLVRHGQSIWNLENKFTGWIDVDLTSEGEEEAKKAGKKLIDYQFDYLFTSVLKRAIKTADIICKEINQNPTIFRDQALNERHYGDLQGKNKEQIGLEFGLEQLHIWRRSYDIPPPNGESLYDTGLRVMPYFENNIVPLLKDEKNVLIVAHGNSLRSLIMKLENISKEEIPNLNIPTGIPYLYKFDKELNIISNNYLN